MAMKQPGRKIYKTANGKNIDLDLLISRNELTPAVGNVKVNARGDELGPGGKIIRNREEVLREYYDKSQGMKEENIKKEISSKQDPIVNSASADLVEWEEDVEGNFNKKVSPTRKKK